MLKLGFEAVDLGDDGLQALDSALVFSADDFSNDPFKHDAKGGGLDREAAHCGQDRAFGKSRGMAEAFGAPNGPLSFRNADALRPRP